MTIDTITRAGVEAYLRQSAVPAYLGDDYASENGPNVEDVNPDALLVWLYTDHGSVRVTVEPDERGGYPTDLTKHLLEIR